MRFYDELYKMKNLIRRGWMLEKLSDKGSSRQESDAEHVFSMLLLAWKIMDEEKLMLNHEKVFKLILCHELGEIDVGDITPSDNVSKEEKYQKELIAVNRIAKEYEMPEFKELWCEFEEIKTEEAKFVKMIDKLDTVMQAKIYSKMHNRPEVFEEFYNNAREKIKGYEKYLED